MGDAQTMKSTLNKFTLIFVTTCSTIIVHSAAYAGWGQTHPFQLTVPSPRSRPLEQTFMLEPIAASIIPTTTAQVGATSGLNGDTILALAVYGTSIYAATFDSGIFISTNNGISWNTMNTGLPSSSITSLVLMGPLFLPEQTAVFFFIQTTVQVGTIPACRVIQ